MATIYCGVLIPDLLDKKDALVAIQIAKDTNESHIIYSGNKAANSTIYFVILATLGAITHLVIKKRNKKELK